MKSRTIIFTQSLLVLLSSILVLSGCVKEQVESNPIKDGEKEVVFAIHVPTGAGGSSQSPKARAIVEDGADDNYVNEVDILMFDASGMFLQNVWCENVDQSVGSDIKIKNVKVRLPKGTGYTFVLLANSHKFYIANALDAGDDISKMYDLAASLEAFGTKWNSIPGHANYKRFPMWGQISGVTIDETNKTFNVDAYRMFAKVNVSVDQSQSTDFELQSVAVYNYNKSGFLVPDATKFAAGKPTEKIDRESGSSPTSLLYSNTNSDGIGGVNYSYINNNATVQRYECIDEIFIPESAVNTGAWAWDNNTCIVIGGTYKGAPAFYRLDFVKNNVNIDVRRNWKYLFEVGTIKTPGYADEQTALKNKPDNIEYTVHPWDEQNVGDLIVEGAIQLSISPKSTVKFSRDTETQGVDIYTNWSEGWKVQKQDYSGTEKYRIEDAAGDYIDWITLDHYGTTAAGEKKLKITVKDNDSGAERKGFIHITTKGGRIQHKLTVEQSDMVPMSLQILRETSPGVFDQEVTTIQFVQDNVATAPTAQNYKIKWTPVTDTVRINMSSLDVDLITWSGPAPDAGGIIADPSGEKTFTVQPTAFTTYVKGTFAERQSLMTARMVISGETVLKTVVFQQMVKDMHIDYAGAYLLDGVEKKHFVTVRSNVNWELGVTKNISSGIDGGKPDVPVVQGLSKDDMLATAGNYNLPQGNKVYFTTVNDLTTPEIYTGHFGLDLVDKTSTLTTISSELLCVSGIVQPLSNSYLVAPNAQLPLLIPVKRANGWGINSGTEFRQTGWTLGNQITGAYSAELVWTDKPHTISPVKSIGDNGAVKKIMAVGSDADGYILVLSGATPGNAVVSASVGGAIVWSWHIWVVDNYNPDPATEIWMSRNLGATTESKSTTSPSALGLYYQWGRKDPIPGASLPYNSIAGTINSTYYLGDGSTRTAVPWSTTGTGTLSNSISDPLQNYDKWLGSNGYDSWITNYNPDLGTGDKTIYDPCPDGWQAPVRKKQAWNNEENTKYWGQEAINVYAEWSSTSGNKWEAAYGITWPNKGGYYPMAGSHYSGGFTYVGIHGYYWGASPNSEIGYYMYFLNRLLYPGGNSIKRHFGLSVRCVTEQP